MGIDQSSVSIERAHRIPSSAAVRPIIVKFSFFRDRERVLKAYRQCRRDPTFSENSNLRIVEDFPERVTKLRTALYLLLMKSINENKTAFFRYDKLVVDKVTYTFDFASNSPVVIDQ